MNERQFLELVRECHLYPAETDSLSRSRYLNEHASNALPDDNDVFEPDGSVNFSEIARPEEHKRAIAVNAFVSGVSQGWQAPS